MTKIVQDKRFGRPRFDSPQILVTEFAVSNVPPDCEDWQLFHVKVAWRSRRDDGVDMYAVVRYRDCYDQDGNVEWESLPSSRTDEFKQSFRFPLAEALEIAKKVLPTLRVNGYDEYGNFHPRGE